MIKTKMVLHSSCLALLTFVNQNAWSKNQINIEAPSFNGVYGGLGMGLMGTRAKLQSNTAITLYNSLSNNPFQIQNSIQKNDSDNIEGFLTLTLGLGQLIGSSNFYAGIEGFYNPETNSNIYNQSLASYSNSLAETLINFPHSYTTLKQENYSYGGDLKLGHLFNNRTLAYIRVGVEFNKTNITSNYTLNYTDLNPTPPESSFSYLNVNKSKTLSGLRLGFGGEYAITKAIHLNMDVIYTGYESLRANGTGNTISPFNGSGDQNVVRPDGFTNTTKAWNIQNLAVLIGLKYYFKN